MTLVLLVEDEEAIAAPLARHLEREGFSVSRARDLAAARAQLAASTPDVVLLDLMLPDGDGRDLCHEVRATSSVPILMLTARAEVADRVLGLAIGADDYIPKPFAAAEVVARIQAILRRRDMAPGDAEDDAPIAIGRVALDPRTRSVTVEGRPIGLAPREFDLLRHLMANAGRVLRREDIMDAVWDPNWFGSTKTLDVHVAWLRRKIEPDPAAPCYIITARGVGFRFATPEDLTT